MQLRYGEGDDLFLQVKSEITSCESRELDPAPQRDWSIPYREFIKKQIPVPLVASKLASP